MSWTSGPIERFINEQEAKRRITPEEAHFLKRRMNIKFGGENVVNTTAVQSIFSGFDGFFEEFEQRFGEFLEPDGFSALGDAMQDESGED